MKKILTLVCCTILIAATSCTKKYISPANTTVIYTIAGTTGWVESTDSEGNSAYASKLKELPELDQYAQENNGVLVYLSYDGGKTYDALPETYNGVSYSYTTTVGKITIYAQNSDGSPLAKAPVDDLTIKVVLVESAQ